MKPLAKKSKRKRVGSDLNEEDDGGPNGPPSSRDQITNQLEFNCSELYCKIKDKRFVSLSLFLSPVSLSNLIALSWRDIVTSDLDDRESELFLDFTRENIFWRNQTIIVSLCSSLPLIHPSDPP
jgi:hypothetical protein